MKILPSEMLDKQKKDKDVLKEVYEEIKCRLLSRDLICHDRTTTISTYIYQRFPPFNYCNNRFSATLPASFWRYSSLCV